MEVRPVAGRGEQPIFYYELGDPWCYLAAERVMSELPVVPEWEPVPGVGFREVERRPVERRAAALGLQPVRWPERWPPDTLRAMLAASYAKSIGRGVAFSLAAFRQSFAAGRDLGDPDTILIAGAACEMHPTALLKGMELRSTSAALDAASARARAAGVMVLPAIQVGDSVFAGDEVLETASAALAREGVG